MFSEELGESVGNCHSNFLSSNLSMVVAMRKYSIMQNLKSSMMLHTMIWRFLSQITINTLLKEQAYLEFLLST